jgi:predicted dehydrogenase
MKKIAVVGFGFMGVVHAKNIMLSENMKLCGIIDNRDGDIFANIETTGNAGDLDLPIEAFKATAVFKSLSDCVNQTQPDAVIICVPLFLHYKLAKEALELGVDVLLEKPFCPELTDCQALIGLAEQQQKILMIAHCIRFAPEWQFLSECIEDQRYGKLELLTTSRIGGEPTWGVWQNDKIKQTCGGSLLDLVIHDLDFANSCFGYPTAIKVNLRHDEYWEIGLEYPDNPATVSIKGGFLYRHAAFESTCAANFSNGSVRFSSLVPGVVNIGTDAGTETVKVDGDAYMNELEYFIKCIDARQTPVLCPPTSSMETIKLCQSIILSSLDT